MFTIVGKLINQMVEARYSQNIHSYKFFCDVLAEYITQIEWDETQYPSCINQLKTTQLEALKRENNVCWNKVREAADKEFDNVIQRNEFRTLYQTHLQIHKIIKYIEKRLAEIDFKKNTINRIENMLTNIKPNN